MHSGKLGSPADSRGEVTSFRQIFKRSEIRARGLLPPPRVGVRTDGPPGDVLALAQLLQRTLVPDRRSAIPGFNLFACSRTAREPGGDFYDFLVINSTSILLIIADVMGSGLPAALFAARAQRLARRLATNTCRPGELLTLLNRMMFGQLADADVFITAQAVLLETDRRRGRVANAGHCPMLIGDRSGNVCSIAPEGIPLGVLPDSEYPEIEFAMGTSSTLLSYTDGIIEARNPRQQLFGQERLVQWFARTVPGRPDARQVSNSLLVELDTFQGSAQPTDDQTLVVLAPDSPQSTFEA